MGLVEMSRKNVGGNRAALAEAITLNSPIIVLLKFRKFT